MKLAVITDSSAYLSDESRGHDNLFVLDIPVVIDGVSYVEGNLRLNFRKLVNLVSRN